MTQKLYQLVAAIFVTLLVAFSPGHTLAQTETEGPEASRKLLIVVNHGNQVKRISAEDLRDIYLGKRLFWSDDTPIIPVDLIEKGAREGKTTHDMFTKQYLGKSQELLKSYWIKMIFSGKGQPPKRFSKPVNQFNFIAENEGAIGYIFSDQLSNKVKTIDIIGGDDQ